MHLTKVKIHSSKNLSIERNRRNLQSDRKHLLKSASIILAGERLSTFPLLSETKILCLLSVLLLNIVL